MKEKRIQSQWEHGTEEAKIWESLKVKVELHKTNISILGTGK